MLFNRKQKDIPDSAENVLDIYNRRENEPVSSVIESADYKFATTRYDARDFRYLFVERYIRYIKDFHGIIIANCKFERPRLDSSFINFYIYLWEDTPDIFYRIEDNNHYFITSFYEILKQTNLPGITDKTRVQFLVKNIRRVMEGRCLHLAWNEIHESIKAAFPEIAYLSYWSEFYVFISSDKYNTVVAAKKYLERIKKYCYDSAEKHDLNNVLEYEKFHIRIDDYENYSSIGGQNYFNSDRMLDCLLY